MSDRTDAFAAVLRERLGDKAARQAAPLLMDLIKRRYCLVDLAEIAPERATGLVLAIARELEADAGASATWEAMQYADSARDACRADARPPAQGGRP